MMELIDLARAEGQSEEADVLEEAWAAERERIAHYLDGEAFRYDDATAGLLRDLARRVRAGELR